MEGEDGESAGQTLRERQFARHAKAGQTFDFRHFGFRVWIVGQNHFGKGIEAFHGTQRGIEVQNDLFFWHLRTVSGK